MPEPRRLVVKNGSNMRDHLDVGHADAAIGDGNLDVVAVEEARPHVHRRRDAASAARRRRRTPARRSPRRASTASRALVTRLITDLAQPIARRSSR